MIRIAQSEVKKPDAELKGDSIKRKDRKAEYLYRPH